MLSSIFVHPAYLFYLTHTSLLFSSLHLPSSTFSHSPLVFTSLTAFSILYLLFSSLFLINFPSAIFFLPLYILPSSLLLLLSSVPCVCGTVPRLDPPPPFSRCCCSCPCDCFGHPVTLSRYFLPSEHQQHSSPPYVLFDVSTNKSEDGDDGSQSTRKLG